LPRPFAKRRKKLGEGKPELEGQWIICVGKRREKQDGRISQEKRVMEAEKRTEFIFNNHERSPKDKTNFS
jgi:hypothetical protein